ncbi:MAG: class I tRNA ligase family protein, partial [Burkholderiales bacterium]|nr:class I tRNA ligase family protein [Burkholderiales bacterium]
PRLAAAAPTTAGASRAGAALRREMHGLLRQISHDYERLQYNTVISGAMKMLNAIEDARIAAGAVGDHAAAASGAVDRVAVADAAVHQAAAADAAVDQVAAADAAVLHEALCLLLRCLFPAAPHITHALWRGLGFEAAQGEIVRAPWPEVDEAALVRDEIELVLQVGGKLRGAIRVPADASHAAIEAAALAAPEFARFAEGRPARKVIVVPGRLVNVVV